jgi:hypothetical protein
MKKLALVTAISAATLSAGAYAQIGSSPAGGAPAAPFTAPDIELWTGGVDIEVDCATAPAKFTTGLELVGGRFSNPTGIDAVSLLGQLCLDPTGTGTPWVGLEFALSGSINAATGTTFNGGSINIWTDFGSGWAYAYTVAAAATPIDCTNAGGKAGLQWNANPLPAVNVLPGATGGTPAPANTVCAATLLGMPATIHLTGANWW